MSITTQLSHPKHIETLKSVSSRQARNPCTYQKMKRDPEADEERWRGKKIWRKKVKLDLNKASGNAITSPW
jgi:hypothetical protein